MWRENNSKNNINKSINNSLKRKKKITLKITFFLNNSKIKKKRFGKKKKKSEIRI